MNILLKPIATAHNSRKSIDEDDDWGRVPTRIVLESHVPAESLAGMDDFSHLEIIYYFHMQSENEIVTGSDHPRENTTWPKVGIFAQRKKARPNRLGATIVEIDHVDVAERTIHVRRFDGIDGTPVLDIKPLMREFLPVSEVRQPGWSTELMRDYW